MRLCLPFLALFLAAPALAQSAPDRDAVRTMLSGFEDAPSAEAWAALGPRTVSVLEALHDDVREEAWLRQRTLWAARFFPTTASRDFLERALSTDEGLALRTAIESLGAAFGEEVLSAITPFLAHADVAVREGAIRAISAVPATAARDALRSRMTLERDESLLALLRTALHR